MTPPPSVIVLVPVYDDWIALGQVLPVACDRLCRLTASFGVLVVDDGSPSVVTSPDDLTAPGASWVKILTLRRNVGHQRAIAIGLSYIDEHLSCDAVVVMDADGEDRPEDLEPLLERFESAGRTSLVFAARERRAEGLTFRFFYRLYQLIHLFLTGRQVRIGNFSVIPRARISSLVTVSELWIHYAAAAVRSRQPIALVPCVRGRRLEGRSHMGFVSLVVHGLSAISAYSDVVFTRLVVGAGVLAALSLLALIGVTVIRLFTTLAIPGWATFASGLLVIVLLQAVMFALGLTFQILGSRQYTTVMPCIDYAHYVGSITANGGEDLQRT